MKEVTVIIAGRSGQGKSSVARIIREALAAKGANVRVFDAMHDTDEILEESTDTTKVNTNVTIRTVTTTRHLELLQNT